MDEIHVHKTKKSICAHFAESPCISIFILLTRRKATEALIHRVGNYPDLLSEMPRYCYPLKIFALFLYFYRDD